MKRRLGLKAAAARAAAAETAPAACALCGRPLGVAVEWHHIVPKSEGGRETVPLHPLCHRTIHATLPNAELARLGPDGLAALRAREDVGRFLKWVAGKPADFRVKVRRGR